MAVKYLIATGNVSDPTKWNGGTKPVTGDDCWANGFTGTIDEDVVWHTMNNYASGPAAEGGSFQWSTNRTITANIYAGTTSCLRSSGAFTTTTIVGNGYGGSAINSYGVYKNHTGDVNLIGNYYGGTQTNTYGYLHNATGNLSHVGNTYGGSLTSAYGIIVTAGIYTGTGNHYAGSSNTAGGLSLSSTSAGFNHTINGNCYSGTGSQAAGVYCINTGNTIINGYAITGPSAYYLSFGVYANGTTHIPTIVGFITNVDGHHPVSGFVKYAASGVNCTVYRGTGEQIVLTDAQDDPAEGDVRDGVQYRYTTKIGTLKVPPKSAVGKDIPTDDGVGEAIFSLDDLLVAIRASSDPLAQRWANVTTTEILAAILRASLA